MDVFHIQQHPFLVTLSRKIKFNTAAMLPNLSKDILQENIFQVVNLYKKRVFRVFTFLVDSGFKMLEAMFDQLDIHANFVSADECVREKGSSKP